MMNEQEIFDLTAENKPQKTMNPKTKKLLIYILCGIIGIALAAALIFSYNAIFAGAATPQEAVAEYQRASLLYDVDGMIEYSSDYNKTVLYGNRETSDRLLRDYLSKGYEGYEASYNEEDLGFKLVSVLEYKAGESKFEEILEKYIRKVENGRDEIEEVAVVRMTVETGKSTTTRDYIVVKDGFRWFFAWAEGV